MIGSSQLLIHKHEVHTVSTRKKSGSEGVENHSVFLYTYAHVLLLRFYITMKLKIDKDLLLERLNTATHFASNRLSSLVALQGALIEASKDKIHFYATNLSFYYHGTLKKTEEGQFKIIVDAKKIVEFLNFLSPGNIDVEVGEKAITFSQGKTRGTFPLMKQEDFPMPPATKEKEQKIKADFLTKNLPLVLFTAAKDETRPVLTAINFLKVDEQLYLISTDGFRLSLMKTKREEEIPQMLVPAEFLSEIIHRIKDEKEIGFFYSQEEKIIVFKMGEEEFSSRLIEGEFPAFERVIPAESKTTVILDKDELLRSVKLVSVFARDYSNIVICDFKNNELRLRPKTDAGNDNGASQEIELKGEEQKVAFNYKYLLDFLNNTSSKKITIEILRPDAPVIFKQEGNSEFLHVIMPVRIQE